MTTNITCDQCESEIDIANDKNCVVYDPSGITAVICKTCRKFAYDYWQERVLEDWPPSITERLHEAYRIKRGWRA